MSNGLKYVVIVGDPAADDERLALLVVGVFGPFDSRIEANEWALAQSRLSGRPMEHYAVEPITDAR